MWFDILLVEYNFYNADHVMQVDIFSMGVIELVNRAGAPLFHIEHYIDGEYIKYNSNLSFKSKFIIAPLFHIEHYIDGEYIKYINSKTYFKFKFIITPLFHIEHYINGEYIKYNSNL